MKDLAIWLGKYMGMTYICAPHLEGYAKHALTKMAYSNASHIRKHLHEMAQSKDHLNHRKRQLETSKQLKKELLELTSTNQSPATASSTVAPPPYNVEGVQLKCSLHRPHTTMVTSLQGMSAMKQPMNSMATKFIGIVGLSLEGEGVSRLYYCNLGMEISETGRQGQVSKTRGKQEQTERGQRWVRDFIVRLVLSLFNIRLRNFMCILNEFFTICEVYACVTKHST